MKDSKIHVRGFSKTLCGIIIFPQNIILPKLKLFTITKIAKRFKDVTCKKCMKSREYQMFLKKKFKEKP